MVERLGHVLWRHWFAVLGIFGFYMLCVAGWVAGSLGVPNLFRNPDDLTRVILTVDWTAARNSPVFYALFFTPLLAAAIWTLAAVDIRRERRALGQPPLEFRTAHFLVGATLLSSAAFLCFLGTVLSTPSGVRGGALLEVGLGGLGLAAGLGAAAMVLRFFVRPALAAAGTPLKEMAFAAAPFAALLLAILTYDRLVPAISLFALVGVLTLVYFVLAITRPKLRLALIALVVALLASANWEEHHRFRFDDITPSEVSDYYADTRLVRLDRRVASEASDDCDAADLDDGLCPIAALEAWREAWARRHGAGKPKLLLVATSGGAYRSAFWTALVLDRIADREAALLDDVRLVSGASGGMVGGAYFVASHGAPERDPSRPGYCSLEAMLTHDTLVAQYPAGEPGPACAFYGPCGCAVRSSRREEWRYIALDSLSPIAQQLIQRDIWRVFAPGAAPDDRGRLLERQWPLLREARFGALAEAERAGLRPSMIFSPMIVESGQPLWISNLRLGQLRAGARHFAVEFFELFPGARPRFRLSTAVRMSATFPYVTPAAVLPTRDPTLRVVDAGYYDNYGMVVANAYLQTPAIRRWILENTSGVMVIQLNAFPTGLRELNAQRVTSLERALYGLTSPLSGAVAARSSTMKIRNDHEFQVVRALYKALDATFPVETVAFVNSDQTSLNWYLTPRELRSLKQQLDSPENEAELAALLAFWRGEGIASD